MIQNLPNTRRRLLLSTTVVTVAALSACSSVWRSPGFEGADATQLAILENLSSSKVSVTRINGVSTGIGGWKRLELKPGSTTVGLDLFSSFGTLPQGMVQLVFEAQAGQLYQLRWQLVQNSNGKRYWRGWIIDAATGKNVSKSVR